MLKLNLPLLILGGGGHAKVLIDTLKLLHYEVIGITDLTLSSGKGVLGIPIIGNDEKVLDYSPKSVGLINGIGSSRSTRKRQILYDSFKKRGYYFPNIVHPSAVLSPSVKLEEGVQIMAGVIIQSSSTIGENTIINTRASIDHDCAIGSHVHIAPGVTLSGEVHVDNHVHVGAGTVVIQGIQIGNGSLIGAGSTVIRNIPDKVKAYGVPTIVVGSV